MRYLDPKINLTFKRIFGEHPDIPISFRNALMPFNNGQTIPSLEYWPPGLVGMPENKVSFIAAQKE